MSVTWSLLRAELLRALRTSSLLRSFLLPVLLGPPAIIGVATSVTTLGVFTPVVAVPAGLPEELDLELALEEEGFVVTVVDDPLAAWRDGDVDAAVLAVEEGDGIEGRRAPERATWWRWRVTGVADTRAQEDDLEGAAEAAGRRAVEGVVSASGGDPLDDVRVAWISTVDVPDSGIPLGIVAAYLVFGLSLPVYYVYGVAGGGDQADGVTEGLLSAGVSARQIAMARALASVVLSAVFAVIVIGQAVTLGGGNLLALIPPAADVARAAAAVVLIDTMYVISGLISRTSREAVQFAALVLVVGLGAVAAGSVAEVPGWVPLVGTAAPASVLTAWLGAAANLVTAGGLVVGVGAALDRAPRRLLGEGR